MFQLPEIHRNTAGVIEVIVKGESTDCDEGVTLECFALNKSFEFLT